MKTRSYPPINIRYGIGILAILALLATVLWLQPGIAGAATRLTAPDPVTAAWAKAKAAGSYQFTSNIVQVTIPTAKVTNVGRSSRTEELYLEGQTNLHAQTMEMHLYSEGGNVLNQTGGLAVKVENGKTLVRKGTGEWKEEPAFSADGLAPGGDFMSFLAAVRNIKEGTPEVRAGIHFTRYTFTIDGPTFAFYMRDRLEEVMRAKGELAPGMQLEVPAYYRDMTGDGELWIGSEGLPLRQKLTLQFPDQKDQQVHAQISVNFSHFGKDTAALAQSSSQLGRWVQATLGWQLPDLGTLLQGFAPWLLLASAMLLSVLLIYYQRRRLVYNALALSVIASMLAGPLLSTLSSAQAFDRYTVRAQAQQQAQQENEAIQTASQPTDEAFNPHIDPLAAAEQTALDSVQLGTGSAVSASSANALVSVAAAANAAALPVGATNWWRAENSGNDQFGEAQGVINGTVTYVDGLVGKI